MNSGVGGGVAVRNQSVNYKVAMFLFTLVEQALM